MERFQWPQPADTKQKGAPYVFRSDRRTVWAPHARLCVVTDTGDRRAKNEDSFRMLAEERVFVVADGIGGCRGGEVASDLAARAAAEHFAGGLTHGERCAESLLASSLKAANKVVLEAAEKCTELRGMGATILIACVWGDRLHTAHLGDVRCYVRSDRCLARLTRDHTPVDEMVADGHLSEEEAGRHPELHVVNQAVGMPTVEPTLSQCQLASGDRVLLCTDGVWGAMGGSDLATILGWQGSMLQISMQLIEHAPCQPSHLRSRRCLGQPFTTLLG